MPTKGFFGAEAHPLIKKMETMESAQTPPLCVGVSFDEDCIMYWAKNIIAEMRTVKRVFSWERLALKRLCLEGYELINKAFGRMGCTWASDRCV